MNALLAAAQATELGPPNVLEWSFIGVLALMSIAIGGLATMVVVRVVEPRGLKVFLRRLAGKA